MLPRFGLTFFLLFVFCSTFSIAASQLSLAICIVLTALAAVGERFNVFAGELRWFWLSVAGYVGWLVLICLLQDDPFYSLDHIREEWLFGIVPAGIYWMRDRRNLDRMMIALAAGVILVGAFGLALHLAGMDYSWGTGFTAVSDRPVPFHGNFAHALTFGNYMAVAGLLLLGYGLLSKMGCRLLTALVLSGGVVAIAGVLMAGSRGPILATCLGLLVLALLSERLVRWLGLGGLVVVVTVVALSPTLLDRFTTQIESEMNLREPRSRVFIWNNALEIIGDNAVMGVGPGNFGDAYSQLLPPDISPIRHYTHAHNDFLQVAARSGVVGLLLFGSIWFLILRGLWRGRRRTDHASDEQGRAVAALVGSLVFLVASLTEATFADEEVRAILMLVWAAGLSVGYKGAIGSGRDEVEPIT